MIHITITLWLSLLLSHHHPVYHFVGPFPTPHEPPPPICCPSFGGH